MKNRICILLLLFLLPVMLTAAVVKRDTTITWHTFDFALNPDSTVDWATTTEYDIVEKTFSGLVLENEFLRVTLVPEYGGRILSMIYKPTGHEQLYQNPCGSPYGIDQDWFYYKWLMVYGGIFPTLPEPEHGKAWFLSWDYEITVDTDDMISVRMSWQDTVGLEDVDYGKWKYGITGLSCDYTVTLASGKSSLQTDIVLSNDLPLGLDYEYWTCLTLAPGSGPGNPMTTAGAKMIIPADQIKVPSWYPDIASQEESVPGQHGLYVFDALRYWENWTNDGIAYPWDDSNENYWGVINQDNQEGLIRIADNTITLGIKIWAWGYEQSQGIDPFQYPSVVNRPYLEIWAGHSHEFFEPAHINANTSIEWRETFVPTVGLEDVSHASEQIVADFYLQNENTALLKYNTVFPDQPLNVRFELTGTLAQVLSSEIIENDPQTGSPEITVDMSQLAWSNGDSLLCTMLDDESNVLLTASLPLPANTTSVQDDGPVVASTFQLFNNYPNPFNAGTVISYQVGERADVKLAIYNVRGERIATLVNESMAAGTYRVNWVPEVSSGVYYCRFEAVSAFTSFSNVHKLLFIK